MTTIKQKKSFLISICIFLILSITWRPHEMNNVDKITFDLSMLNPEDFSNVKINVTYGAYMSHIEPEFTSRDVDLTSVIYKGNLVNKVRQGKNITRYDFYINFNNTYFLKYGFDDKERVLGFNDSIRILKLSKTDAVTLMKYDINGDLFGEERLLTKEELMLQSNKDSFYENYADEKSFNRYFSISEANN